jgi:hypothetical protein
VPDIELKVEANLTQVVNDAYSDGVKSVLSEVSAIGVDALKTVRLALAPLQFAASLQDRLAGYIKRAYDKIPVEDRVSPVQSLALPVLEKLRYQENGDLLTEIYINLLSSSFDKRRLDSAHPAFIMIVSQLSSDEAVLLNSLSESELKKFFGSEPLEWAQSSKGIVEKLNESVLEPFIIDWAYFINPDIFTSPRYLQIYISHMVSLGIVEYTNTYSMKAAFATGRSAEKAGDSWAVKISKFGRLFHHACIGDAVRDHLRATPSDRI